MTIDVEQMRADMRAENKRFLWQAVASMGAAAGGGAAVLALILHQMGKL